MSWRKFREYSRDNYGIIISEKEAEQTRKRFFELYSGLLGWHKRQKDIARSQEGVRNPIGRWRHLPSINSRDGGAVAEAGRQAINSPVQGMGSDYTLMAMNEVMGTANLIHENDLDRSRFDCVGSIHDAVLFEVDVDYLEKFIEIAKPLCDDPRVVKEVFNFHSPIPISFDVTVGTSWGEGHELDMSGNWREELKEVLEKEGMIDGKKEKSKKKTKVRKRR